VSTRKPSSTQFALGNPDDASRVLPESELAPKCVVKDCLFELVEGPAVLLLQALHLLSFSQNGIETSNRLKLLGNGRDRHGDFQHVLWINVSLPSLVCKGDPRPSRKDLSLAEI